MSDPAGPLLEIPEEFVPVRYALDPETEELVSGLNLQPGMIVVLRYDFKRGNPDHFLQRAEPGRQFILQNARWCRIERVTSGPSDYDDKRFTALYADGSLRTRTTHPHTTWIVKKASIAS